MEQKQTAVEYLVEQLFPKALSAEQYYHIEQAKEMEKQHSIQFARHCLEKANRTFDLDILTSFIDVPQYYNEEYGK